MTMKMTEKTIFNIKDGGISYAAAGIGVHGRWVILMVGFCIFCPSWTWLSQNNSIILTINIFSCVVLFIV